MRRLIVSAVLVFISLSLIGCRTYDFDKKNVPTEPGQADIAGDPDMELGADVDMEVTSKAVKETVIVNEPFSMTSDNTNIDTKPSEKVVEYQSQEVVTTESKAEVSEVLTATDYSTDECVSRILEGYNNRRIQLNKGAVNLSSELSKYAKTYSDKMAGTGALLYDKYDGFLIQVGECSSLKDAVLVATGEYMSEQCLNTWLSTDGDVGIAYTKGDNTYYICIIAKGN